MASAKMVRADRSFAAVVGKAEFFIREGELVPAMHPVAKAHPELFAPAPSSGATTPVQKKSR